MLLIPNDQLHQSLDYMSYLLSIVKPFVNYFHQQNILVHIFIKWKFTYCVFHSNWAFFVGKLRRSLASKLKKCGSNLEKTGSIQTQEEWIFQEIGKWPIFLSKKKLHIINKFFITFFDSFSCFECFYKKKATMNCHWKLAPYPNRSNIGRRVNRSPNTTCPPK